MNNGSNGSGDDDCGDFDEKTEPDILFSIYNEVLRQSKILEAFDKKLFSLENSINVVMDSYIKHTERLSSLESTCELRGKILSRLTLATPISPELKPEPEADPK